MSLSTSATSDKYLMASSDQSRISFDSSPPNLHTIGSHHPMLRVVPTAALRQPGSGGSRVYLPTAQQSFMHHLIVAALPQPNISLSVLHHIVYRYLVISWLSSIL